MPSWDDVAFRIEIATGIAATETLPGGEWDVDDWDDAAAALWGGTGWLWTDITDDYVRLSTKRGRTKWGAHYTAGTATVVLRNLDGIYSPTQPPEADLNLVAGNLMRIVAEYDGTDYVRFTGTVRNVKDRDLPGQVPLTTVQLVDAFAYLAGVNRIALGSAVGAGQLPGARLEDLLDDISWPDELREIGDGVETLQATTKAGNLLAEMYLVADSEGGELYVDRDGVIVFADRDTVDAQAAQTPTLTVAGYADPGGAGEWICWADYQPEYALDLVRNDASIARAGGTVQTATDATSIASYGKKTVVRTDLLNQSDTWPAALAARIVAARKDVAEQIVGVTLTEGEDAETVAALGLEIGDPIRTRRLVGSGASQYEVDENALIQGIDLVASPAGEKNGARRDDWQMTLTTDKNYSTS